MESRQNKNGGQEGTRWVGTRKVGWGTSNMHWMGGKGIRWGWDGKKVSDVGGRY